MRASISRKLLQRMEQQPSDQFRIFEIRVLNKMSAKAFGVPVKKIHADSPVQALKQYACFSKSYMENGTATAKQVYKTAYVLGSKIRRVTGFSKPEDCARLVFFLYRNIGIVMQGNLPGEIAVSGCYFSRCYTPAQCKKMSYIDSGIVAGICGGGHLRFSQRITEGCSHCMACLYQREEADR